MRIGFILIVLMALVGFGLDFFDVSATFENDVIATIESKGFLSVMKASGMFYNGDVNLHSRHGDVDKIVRIEEGFGEFHFVPHEGVKVARISVEVWGEKHEISTFVLPRAVLSMGDWYLEVKEFAGTVGVKRGNSEITEPVKLGSRVFPGDCIYTSKNSYVVLVGPKGVTFSVVPNSVVYVKMVRKNEKDMVVQMKVDAGDVLTNVMEKLSTDSLIIMESEGVAAGVRGTIFSFERSDQVKIRTFRGEVSVIALGKGIDVSAGNMAVIPKTVLNRIEERLEWFDYRVKRAFERFEMKAKKALRPFGLQDFLSPLDRTLTSYKEMFKKLRLMQKRGK